MPSTNEAGKAFAHTRFAIKTVPNGGFFYLPQYLFCDLLNPGETYRRYPGAQKIIKKNADIHA